MSVVTGVVLSVSVCEERREDEIPVPIAALNAWLVARDFRPMPELSKHTGGNKHPQILIYAAGYNYFPEDEFAAVVLGQSWELRENVVLLLNPEDGPTRVFRTVAVEIE